MAGLFRVGERKMSAWTLGGMRYRSGVSALALAGLVLTACGDSGGNHTAKAEQAIEKDRYRDAAVHLRNAVQEDRQNPELRLMLGRVALELKDADTAAKELSRARELGAEDPDLDADLARAWQMAGEFANVLEVTGEDPDSAMLKALRGRALFMQGETGTAETALRRSLEMEETAAAHVALGMLAQQRGERESALRHAEAALALDPTDQEAANIKARMLHADGESQAALAALDDADEQIRGKDLSNLALRTSILLDTGDQEGAEDALKVLQEHAGNAALTKFLESRLFLARQDFTGAKVSAEAALGQAPDHSGALYVAAIANAQLGNTNSARQQVSRLASLQPGNEQVQRLRDALNQGPNRDRQLASLEDPEAALIPEENERSREEEDAGSQSESQLENLDDASRALVESARNALTALRGERFEDALALGEEMSADFPDNAAGPNLQGLAYRGLEQPDKAIEAFQEAVEREPENESASTNLAEMYRVTGRLDAAAKVLEDALEHAPESANLLFLRARVALAAGDTAQSETLLKKAAEQDNESIRAEVALARLYLATERPREALDIMTPLLEDRPESELLLDMTGSAYTALGEPEAAGDHFARLADKTNRSEIRVRAAQSYINAGDSDAAVAQLRKLLDRQPGHLSGRQMLAQELLRMGDTEAAKAEIDRVAEQAPDQAQTSSLLARYHFMQEEYDEAIAHFRDTLERAPGTARAMDLARAQWLADRRQDARTTLENWLAEHQNDDRARLRLADYLMGLEEHAAAKEHYETLLERHEGNAVVHNNLANALLKLGQTEAAAAQAERAMEAAPDNAAIRDTLGEVRLAQGQPEEAAEHFQAAAQGAPDNARYRLNHARALAETGDIDQARALLDTVISEAGDPALTDEARELRSRL